MTTKILALPDALGNLVRFVLLPGHRFDTVGVAPLIDALAFGGLIADKAFDRNAIIAELNERGAKMSSRSIRSARCLCRSTPNSTSGGPQRLVHACFGAHHGLKSNIALSPKRFDPKLVVLEAMRGM